MQSIWTLVVIVGPILFITAIIFVTIRNKLKSTPKDEAFTERATRQRKKEEANAPKEVDGPLG